MDAGQIPELIGALLSTLQDDPILAVALGSAAFSLVLLVLDDRLARRVHAETEPATVDGEFAEQAAAEVCETSPGEVAPQTLTPRAPQQAQTQPSAEPDAPTADEISLLEEPEPGVSSVSQPGPAYAPPPEPEPASAFEPEPELVRVSLRERLAKTSQNLVGRIGGILGGRTVDSDLLDDLEGLLFTADLGVGTAESLLEAVKNKASGADAARVREVLRDAILEKLQRVETPEADVFPSHGPMVILVLGVNGSGKTTTIGKLAAKYGREGKKVILGAGDTYRAAATEQLQVWGERAGCEVIAGKPGGDPAAVAFDTVKAAVARGADVCIVDTAGRLQTKKPLMEELGKINRVLSRDLPEAPHQCLLVLDSNTGQNAISQARLFAEVAQITGLVLTKLDGTAKGGVIIGLADEFDIPVRYVGVGEGVDDLRHFDAREFVDALFEEN